MTASLPPDRTAQAIRHRVLETSLGPLTLVGAGDVLTGVYYPAHRPSPDRSVFGELDPAAFAVAARELVEYLAGQRTCFTLPSAAVGGSPLRRAVWERIAAIPYGETCTYRRLAREFATHPRAVGGAVAHNPLSIVVPCHRMVGSDGSLAGYAGGLTRKRTLLALERTVAASAEPPPR